MAKRSLDSSSIDDAAGEALISGMDPDEIAGIVGNGKRAKKMTLCGIEPNGNGWSAEEPTRDEATGALLFPDRADFVPNLTPAEVLRAGSFGGGYFRPITSTVTGVHHDRVWEELPDEWLEGVDIGTHVSSLVYNKNVNKFGVGCGAKAGSKDTFGQAFWEQKGWIKAQDPFGWFHWYCRFYQGRRSDDDERQVSRWLKCCGPKGRWKQNLIGKCLRDGKSFDDASVSPVVRQTLQHWAYRLTKSDYEKGAARVLTNGAAYLPKGELQAVRAKAEAKAEAKAGAKAKGKKAKRDGKGSKKRPA